MTEVKKHNTPDNAWMVSNGKIYDVSGWYNHPGGNVIFTHAGSDFTDIFAAFHPVSAHQAMKDFYIGELVVEDEEEDKESDDGEEEEEVESHEEFMSAYRALRSRLIAKGFFKASPLYYTMKVLSNFMILGASIACCLYSSLFVVHMIGAVLLGLFWQQSGWLTHDFVHHQVFKDRWWGDMVGYILGNMFQGFSVAWWKDKHNAHHAVPNLHSSDVDAHDGDPDIDTMPLLAWSLNMAKQANMKDKSARFFIVHQATLYFPLLLLARIAWLNSSYQFVFGVSMMKWEAPHWTEAREKIRNKGMEKFTLILFLVWMVWLHFQLPLLNSICFFILSQTSCGFMLALVFGLGHNGMATYEAQDRPDFWRLQVTTTRNVTSNWWVDWFCGGLQYQVDHHLFPTCPRHHLKKVHEYVEEFCREHKVTYHEAGMWVGTIEVLRHLDKISQEFVHEFPSL